MNPNFFAYSYILIIGLFIDGLQAGMSLGLAVMVSTGSTIPIIGQLLAPVLIPSGILLGIAIAFSISSTLGGGFLVFLKMKNMFYPEVAFFGLVGEVVPGINNLPLWTAIAWRSISKKLAEDAQRRKRSAVPDEEEFVMEAPSQQPQLTTPAAVYAQPATQTGSPELPRERPARVELRNPRIGSDITPRSMPLAANDNRQKTAYAA